MCIEETSGLRSKEERKPEEVGREARREKATR